MKEPTLEQIDAVRKEGYRPGVVACIINNKRILMFYKEEYKLWLLPQGGIKNKETPKDALSRMLSEELGVSFVANLDLDSVKIVDTDRMEFKPGRHEMAELNDDEGNSIEMIGKDYYFCVVNSNSEEIILNETLYDQHFWMTFNEACFIAERIYQKGKKRVTIKIINTLHSLGLVQ